ncbi:MULTISPECIES: MFS transporter [Acetobacter]|jgi:DHA2 family multidrug resistance protein|uniref:DHA2 family multidrug resistance protein n=1 Tax=Acetobacter lovaniensis TaxID=104100 RepID=A0A841QEU4_9PROT|nr:MFS transporter [Acetobacter lovaniensis]MBB6457489.1 DHA2 family multidrug resistance protein [Acetobacter lovaniensis]MCI1794952.1 MFS transporter [Acetobacter lovaniensis]MCP1240358.1 MFS transporter [Acetobacter lovaniensis]NHN81786.1 MFS transporter [Acetobacter lovaniensis]
MTNAAPAPAAGASVIHASPPQFSYIPPFGLRTVIGCLGMLLAVHVAGFNEHVTDIGLSDIRGAMHIGHDEGTWLIAIYEAFNIAAMAFTPWFYTTFSIYRFSIFVTAVLALLSIPAPFMPDVTSLCILRAFQGLSGGCLPPVLMTVMLKYLPPQLRVFGIGGYAMSATFGPNLGLPLEAFWFEHVGWHWLYWEVIPTAALAIAMMAYGLPRDPMHFERFEKFNWLGILVGLPSICSLVIVLYQGDRLDWFRSPIITNLTFWGGAAFIVFVINEAFHPSPYFRIQYWRSRNIQASLLSLVGILAICSIMAEIPAAYLQSVRGYRPIQMVPVSLVVALPQLIMLPLIAWICNNRKVDCRFVLAGGMVCLAVSAWLGTWLTVDWVRDNFYPLQILQVFGQPMTVIPTLMLATMAMGPADGPFISGMVNMLKGLASAVAFAIFSTATRRREQYHSTMLLDHHGTQQLALQGMANPIDQQLGGTSVDGAHVAWNGLQVFHTFVHEQSLVLALTDLYYVLIWVCLGYAAMNLVLPHRVYPPRAPAPNTPAH